MELHVLQLGPYPPPEGGITHNILAIRDELHRRGHRCSIVATSKSSQTRNEPDVYHPRSAAALLRLLLSLEYDVLHLHVGGNITPRVAALATVCGRFAKGRNVMTLHSGAYPRTAEARAASPKSTRGRIFRRFEHLLAVNQAIADVFRRYGVLVERISVVPPYSLAAPDENVRIPDELAAFCDGHSPFLLSIGGLEADYEPLFLIAAMQEVGENFPNAGLMIVGDGSMRPQVEDAIALAGLGDRIKLAGAVDHRVTLHLLQKADVMLRTTLFDGDAISVREALFLGTPVIATDTAPRPDGVHLIGVGEIHALQDGLQKVLTAPRPQPLKVEGRDNIARVVDLYEDILTQANRSSSVLK